MYLAAMNPREVEDAAFDKLADGELRRLERALSKFDPDEVEAYLGGDVLNITLGNDAKIVINRHRAARQIWMAALCRAWHFTPAEENGVWTWRTQKEELRQTLAGLLLDRTGHAVKL